MRRTLTVYLVFLIFLCFPAFSQKSFKINFKIKGISDTTCLIANYYGNGTYIKDTVKLDGSGRCTYKTQSDMPEGLYIFVISDKLHFDFVLNQDARFSMETDQSDLIGKMKIEGSPENLLFYQYLNFNKIKYDEILSIQKEKQTARDQSDSLCIQKKADSINQEIIAYKLNLINKFPSTFLAFMLNAMKEPIIPSTETPSGKIGNNTIYLYYYQHFWNGTDFSDERLLRTPVFHTKLQKYLDKIVIQNPDTLIIELDRLIRSAETNPEMFKYLIWFATYHYENSEIMGFDKIFVHLVDKYYVTGRTPWINQVTLENIIKKANRLRPILIGERAPNMIMTDTNNRLVSMHNLEAKFLVLLFWDPSCGHCEQEIPKIKQFYDEYHDAYGIKILAVCSDTSLANWKLQIKKKKMNWINVSGPRTLTGDFHEQYDISVTPVIFILNEKKEIIAKNLRADQLQFFMKNYLELNKE